jgi:DNA polymerase-3 subunit alpha (Gram-positive type)
MTGITQDMVRGKPSIKEALNDFISFAGDSVLVAHNSDFDMGFLKYHIGKELGRDLSNRLICTVKVSRVLVPGLTNYKLHTVAGHFGIPLENRHRAMGDSEITYHVWNNLVGAMMEKGLTTFDEIERIMAV